MEGDAAPCLTADVSANRKQAAVTLAVTPHASGREVLITMRGGGMEVHQLSANFAEVQLNELESMRYWLETV